jgi:hypothetical protein
MYRTYFFKEQVTKVKPDFNSAEVHPQLGHNCHPVDGASDFFGGEFLPIFWKKGIFCHRFSVF